MRVTLLLAVLGITLAGCTQQADQTPNPSAAKPHETLRPAEEVPPSHPAITTGETGTPVLPDEQSTSSDEAASAPDNTTVNQRDRNHTNLLPTDQGESESDLQTTAEIRRRIVDLSEISIAARNIKIITRDGKVTLRGPVATENERQTLERIARDVAGQDTVESQLEVTRS